MCGSVGSACCRHRQLDPWAAVWSVDTGFPCHVGQAEAARGQGGQGAAAAAVAATTRGGISAERARGRQPQPQPSRAGGSGCWWQRWVRVHWGLARSAPSHTPLAVLAGGAWLGARYTGLLASPAATGVVRGDSQAFRIKVQPANVPEVAWRRGGALPRSSVVSRATLCLATRCPTARTPT